MYFSGAASISKEPILETMDDGFTQGPRKSQKLPYVANVEISSKSCPAVERSVYCSKNSPVLLEAVGIDGMKSTVGSLQLFSNKSLMSLSAVVLQFYPIHITLLKFSGEHRRKPIASEIIVVEYLPAIF